MVFVKGCIVYSARFFNKNTVALVDKKLQILPFGIGICACTGDQNVSKPIAGLVSYRQVIAFSIDQAKRAFR
jgi:hypothetical protein